MTSTVLTNLQFSITLFVTPTYPIVAAFRAFAASGSGPQVPVPSGIQTLEDYGSVDNAFYADRIDKVKEPERRAFAYLMLTTVRFAYASAARLLVVKIVASLSISASAAALATADFDLSNVEFGETITVKWRGKPIFIRRRKDEEIAEVRAVPLDHLRDRETDEERVLNPEWIVVIAICPHLGCVPVSNAGEFNGWFCPCHGSHYDISGRIRKGPAPLNLEVPPYKFIDEKNLLIG
jgi:ubiquinol-cytochrome c reductase iron-sulfur subunit